MKPAYLAAAAIALILTIKACGPYMSDSDIKQNPNPKLRYELTLTIDGAPGPFDSVEGTAFYEVTSENCVPVTGKPLNSMRIPPQKDVAISFTRTDENSFRGTVYLDLLRDDDYYGMGVCHWSLSSFAASAFIGDAAFVSSALVSKLIETKISNNYFSRLTYVDAATGNRRGNVFGELRVSRFGPKLQDQLFSIKIQATEGFE